MHLTTLTQFGARLSLAKLHVKKLLESSDDEKVNHLFYLVDPANIKLKSFLQKVASETSNVSLFTRDDNDFTPFYKLRRKAPYGGDYNYDFLIRRDETKDIFLTLHDDSIIECKNLYEELVSHLKSYEFGGYLDTREEIDGYSKMYIDNIPLTKLRVGTWFMYGLKEEYLKSNYTIADYSNYWKYFLYFRYNFNKRLRFKNQKVWLNGGFDFNIRARLEDRRIQLLDNEEKKIATHLTKITGFFAAEKRQMLQYADQEIEVEMWKKYAENLLLREELDQYYFDRNWLLDLSSTFEDADIKDELLNCQTINEIFNKSKN